jgi:D-alanine-D-alanine ligase-like ATP-grasp enzyme
MSKFKQGLKEELQKQNKKVVFHNTAKEADEFNASISNKGKVVLIGINKQTLKDLFLLWEQRNIDSPENIMDLSDATIEEIAEENARYFLELLEEINNK